MILISRFNALNLSLSRGWAYLFCTAFVVGNILFPQLCHLIPDGGKIFLPIYFFTLIAGYKFGLKVGLLTAVLSPLCNHLLFGMPPLGVLPVLLIKSSLLAVMAALVARRSRCLSVFHLALVVVAYQVVGGFAEWVISGQLALALQDFRMGFPGMLLQVVAGWGMLKLLARYEL